MIKILTFSSLYPNVCQPRHGIFVEHRLRQLLTSERVAAQVVAPVPWFPFKHSRFGKYGTFAAVPSAETRHGIAVTHPRYLVIPKIGMNVAPLLMSWALLSVFHRVATSGYDFDLIDAHYFYPDGVAAILLGQHFNRPVVITARGSDVNEFPSYAIPRRFILWAANRCQGIITVSRSLADSLVQLGVNPRKITPLRNGVDLNLFHPVDREAARRRLSFNHKTILSVGLLREGKGHHLLIEALTRLPDAELVIIGEGSQKPFLIRLINRLKLAKRVRFVGNVSQEALREFYTAADILALATQSEGMPNVVLEALACGTPVVATAVSGIPEIVTDAIAGVLVDERDPAAFAQAIAAVLAAPPDREAVRRFAERFSWDATTAGQLEVFDRVLEGARSAHSHGREIADT